MQAVNNNVTLLNQKTVHKHIQSFLKSKGENTSTEYERDIRQFFSIVKNVEIEVIEPSDLKLLLPDVLDYQTFLSKEFKDAKGEKYKNITVNRKLNTVKALYKFLAACEYPINLAIFQSVKDLPDDTEHIGFLTPDESRLLGELALTEKHNALEKKALILTAVSTSMRKEALLNIRFCDIRKSDDDDNKYIISSPELFDKGKRVHKEIHKILFDLIMETKGDKQDTDKIFTLSNMGISHMMKRLCQKAGFDPRRNISMHSLRKSGTQLAYELSGGDMFTVTAQGGWSSPDIAYKTYLKPQSNISGMGMFEKLGDEVFDELSREELLQLVKGIGNGLGIQLKREAKKIVEARK